MISLFLLRCDRALYVSAIKNTMGLKIILLFSILFISSFCEASSLKEIERKIGVEIIFDTSFQGTWESVTYKKVLDTVLIQNYLDILLVEYSKYPKGYLNKARVNKIIICDSLIINGQRRAAIPDPKKNALYLEINSSYSKNYLIHVMHHELHHCAEYSLYGNMYYNWKKWNKKNKVKFRYGFGGANAYKEENSHINYYSMSHPEKGFVNLYSMLGTEEDRSEILALIMNYEERKKLLEFVETDRILKRKVKLIIKEINTIAETKFISWKEIKVKNL